MRATPHDEKDIGYDVPASVRRTLPALKDALAETVRDVLTCSALNDTPATIEKQLATRLKANARQPAPGTSVSNSDPRYQEALSSDWSSNLQVRVATAAPDLLQVQLAFNIICGEDTVLLVFQRESNVWHEVLRWQAAPYKQVSGAFGDGFFTGFLRRTADTWQIVTVHGHPWCTSRFSGFDIDVLAPGSDAKHPRLTWHTERGYSRGDYPERLRVLSPDTFEFRTNADAMEFDPENGFERTVVYRYRVSSHGVTRLEPIATNARGFVEEWLSMPWQEAVGQSAPEAVRDLRVAHALYERSYPKGKNEYTSWTAGPVLACSTKGLYQVAFETELQVADSGKPNANRDGPVRHYFHIQQVENGYRMESASGKADPSCGGPDMMQAGKKSQ